MDSLEKISASKKALLFKVAVFDIAILVSFVFLSLFFSSRYKLRMAERLAEAYRAPLIAGDNRQIMLDMSRPVGKDFVAVFWIPSRSGYSFSIPASAEKPGRLESGVSDVSVFFDEQGSIEAGALRFYYHRWEYLPIVILLWLVLVMLSALIGAYEWRRQREEYRLKIELSVNEMRADLAAQVAHDIRSPLAALGAAAREMKLPDDQRTLFDGAIGRMQGIADDLLQRYRAPGAGAKAKMETVALAGLIEQVLAEKRIQHKDRVGVKIEFGNRADGAKAAVDPKELQRVISNLVNNAVEAFDIGGTVSVALAAADGQVLVEIKDDGKGIPREILAKLGHKGETHGKTGGTGLGLYHARTAAESWGGALKIESELGKGTAVTIALPAAAKPPAALRAALLDDDPLVHMNWKMAAKAAGAELISYKTTQEFAAGTETLPRDIPLYIDSELGNDVKGEDIAKDLHDKGFTDVSMATGHDAAKFAHLPWLKVTGKEPPWA